MTTKEKVFAELKEKNGKSVSGELLAEHCQVSRAAIWKAVNALRKEGFKIEGTTNGGYLLSENIDVFSEGTFASDFYGKFPQFQNSFFQCFKEIDSTNTYAKRLLSEAGPLRNENQELTESGKKFHKSVFIAESQTAGHGRSGRAFASPAKTGIYISIIYAPEGGIKLASRITAFTAVAVCRAIKNLYKKETAIKWINDIFCNGKKICGILTEGTANFETGLIEAAVIGIGINIADNPDVFTGNLSKVAGGILDSEEKCSVTRSQFASEVAAQVLMILEENPLDVIEEYKKLSFITGKTITVHSIIDNEKGDYSAKVIDIDENAGLVVELSDGTIKTLISGEVSLNSSEFVKA